MTRAALIVLDSFGVGHAPDARVYGDQGADTLGNIATACAQGRADQPGLRSGQLHMPHFAALGLGLAAACAGGTIPAGLAAPATPTAAYGSAIETSRGKDTPSGHWEIAGAPVDFDWGYFPALTDSVPEDLVAALIKAGNLPGILGNCHASGTQIIEQLGAQHCASGKPILYTSVDSVLQIAAHETAFGLERLYALCQAARDLCNDRHIGRVIARPFAGHAPDQFTRTGNRRDFAMPPPLGNLLDRAAEAGRAIITIGKIGDIFAHRATGLERHGFGNDANIDATLDALKNLPDGGLIFANYVDFDSEYGHRRDVAGYAAALERLDARLPQILGQARDGDLLVFTADHGNDPTWRGTDHTREQVPVLVFQPGITGFALGQRSSFADIGASIARHLAIGAPIKGTNW